LQGHNGLFTQASLSSQAAQSFLFDAVCDTLKLRLHNVQQAKMMSAVCATQNQTFWMSLRQRGYLVGEKVWVRLL
jgi:hypothetical protein